MLALKKKVSSIRILMETVFFVGCCHVLDNLVTVAVIVLIQFQSVNHSVRQSTAGFQRHQMKYKLSP